MLITLFCTICANFVTRKIERILRSCLAIAAVAFVRHTIAYHNYFYTPKSGAESLSSIMSSRQMTPVERRRSHGGF
jgi:hypothetical protein